VLVVNS